LRYKGLAERVIDNSTRDVDQGLPMKGEWFKEVRALVGVVLDVWEHGWCWSVWVRYLRIFVYFF
jgi:hypothetical protein